MRWTPYRLGLALECLDAGQDALARNVGEGGVLGPLIALLKVLLG